VRSGYLLPLAAIMQLAGSQDFSVAVAVSVAASILTLLLATALAFRYFGPDAALGAAVILSGSVVELGLARRAWQDSVFCLFNLLLFGLAAEVIRRPERKRLYVLYHAVGALCLLTKPSAPVLYALCSVALAALLYFRNRTPIRAFAMLAGGLAAVAMVIGVWTGLSGSWGLTMDALVHSFQPGAAAWEYSKTCCSGPVWQLGLVMSFVTPLGALLTVLGMAEAIRTREGVGCTAAFVFVGFFLFLSVYKDLQSVRYLSPVFGICAVLAGAGFAALLKRATALITFETRPAFYALLAAIAVASLARDYRVFNAVKTSALPDLGAVQVRAIFDR